MKPQNELALIVAYYLSRLDKDSYIKLGYASFNEAAREIGATLSVKSTTIKNMRDEFDYHLQNSRIGWRRELRGSRLKVLLAFQMTTDSELLEVVKEILLENSWKNSEGLQDIHTLLNESEKKSNISVGYILRGPTGKAAENYYMEHFKLHSMPSGGNLVDCREFGCGYDFEILKNDKEKIYVEVKGLADITGGIAFTDKEWKTAKEHGDDYYLAIVRNVSNDPEIEIIQNPATKLNPKKNIHTTVQVSWNVSDKILGSL